MKAANTYYDAAEKQVKTDPDEALNFYKKSIDEYMAIKLGSDTNTDKKFAEDRIEECLGRIDRIRNPQKYAKKQSVYGNNEVEDAKQKFDITVPGTSYVDVVGMQDVKDEITEAIIWPLTYPKKFKDYVGKAGEGILLYGPPGCGKTFIVKAAVGEANKQCQDLGMKKKVSFIYISSSKILDKWVGNSEKNMRRVFEFAVENEPCILFFDDLDSMGGSRTGQSTYADRLLTEFLTAFDIIDGKLVLVAGATNKPWRIDSALQRSKRFTTKIMIPPPDFNARVDLFKMYSKDKPVNQDIDIKQLATYTDCYASSDIEAICREAGKKALRGGGLTNDERKIEYTDFIAAVNDPSLPSSLYQWSSEFREQVERGRVTDEYARMVRLLETIEAKKPKNNGANHKPEEEPEEAEG